MEKLDIRRKYAITAKEQIIEDKINEIIRYLDDLKEVPDETN